MAKPVILAVDDDPQVLRAGERDLLRRYAKEYRFLRADPALDTLWKLKQGKRFTARSPLDVETKNGG